MTTTADRSKAALLRRLREQWTASEVAVRQCEDAFDAPALPGWSAGDIFRHLVGWSHRLAPDLLQSVYEQGELSAADTQAVNAADVAKFAALSAKMVQIELSVAHGTLWMYLQRYTDADLEKRIRVGGNEMAFGALLDAVCGQHEQRHVAEAVQAAGRNVKPAAPFHAWS